jgi:hypothetical protein
MNRQELLKLITVIIDDMAQRDKMIALYKPWLMQFAASMVSQLADSQIQEFELVMKSICSKIK